MISKQTQAKTSIALLILLGSMAGNWLALVVFPAPRAAPLRTHSHPGPAESHCQPPSLQAPEASTPVLGPAGGLAELTTHKVAA